MAPPFVAGQKRWANLPTMEGQRVAARLFGAASLIAGDLWRGLPAAMRRLADGGAFNRLVGQCRVLLDGDGCIGDVEGLRNLDLSADSTGPHRVAVDRGEDGAVALRLLGMDALAAQLDEALGGAAGRRSRKYVVANRFINDGICRERVEWGTLGFCHGWGVREERRAIAQGRMGATGLRPRRRVRVWVWATAVTETAWDPRKKAFEGVYDNMGHHSKGLVTDWVELGTYRGDALRAAGRYDVVSAEHVLQGCAAGPHVVFTAVEVAERRGRHWVRLPWCCKVRVSDVVLVAPGREPAPSVDGDARCVLGTGVLRPALAREVAGIGCRLLDRFDLWAAGRADGDDFAEWFIGRMEAGGLWWSGVHAEGLVMAGGP